MAISRATLKWLLTGSLAVNAFFIGGIAVHRFGGPPHHGPPDAGHMVEEIARPLSSADQAVVRAAFAAHEQALRQGLATMNATPARIRETLAREPFDREALRAVLEAGKASREMTDDAAIAAILDGAERLSPEGRRLIAQEQRRGP